MSEVIGDDCVYVRQLEDRILGHNLLSSLTASECAYHGIECYARPSNAHGPVFFDLHRCRICGNCQRHHALRVNYTIWPIESALVRRRQILVQTDRGFVTLFAHVLPLHMATSVSLAA